MNLKSAVIIEVEKNERKYSFSMPVGAPYGECYDAAFEVLKSVVELSTQALNNLEQKKADQPQGE